MLRIRRVPFVDLHRQYLSIQREVAKALRNTFKESQYILGPNVKKFEIAFAKFLHTKYVIAVSNGTDALHLALRTLNIGAGDDVLIPANTFIATALAVSWTGAKPVLVDCDPTTYNIDLQLLEKRLTKRTRAIIVVHLYGNPVNMDTVMTFARRHKLAVIEDTCQAHGATWRGKTVGTFGDIGCYSFYPTKNLGAYGDGGALSTNNVRLANQLMSIRNYGESSKYHYIEKGYNNRLDDIQGAILQVKLRHLKTWNAARRKLAQEYMKRLQGNRNIVIPTEQKKGKHVYHLFVIRAKKRDALQTYLRKKEIGTQIHYPVPIALQQSYRELSKQRRTTPVTQRIATQLLSLPIFPEMTITEVRYVVKKIVEFYK